jgi:Protein of unknown function (DUF2948)
MSAGLKLLARDEEDLKVISAHLQDAIVRVGDLAYLPRQHRFAAYLNRFCWEDCGDGAAGERMRAGLHFDGVLKAQASHVRQEDPDAILELLAIAWAPDGMVGGRIDLLFAGGGCIRLSVECIDATLRDMGGPWPAKARPEHEVEGPAKRDA